MLWEWVLSLLHGAWTQRCGNEAHATITQLKTFNHENWKNILFQPSPFSIIFRHSSHPSSTDFKTEASSLSCREELTRSMKEVREGVDEVKGVLSDIMAEEMGRRLTCVHQ